VATTTKAEATREIGDAVSYAIGHGIRIQILVTLNEGSRSPSELARLLRVPLSKLQHHIVELVRSGSIEEADTRVAGNVVEHLYRAVKRSEYSAEEMNEMGADDQRVTIGLALQNALAEHLAAFRADAMSGDDPNLVLSWNWFNVDAEGRAELTAELEESWQRLLEVETRASARRVRSGEEPQSVVVSSIGHPRVRPAPEERPFGSLVVHEQ
jgi:DNA-binding transcriptional ArsR family regulator